MMVVSLPYACHSSAPFRCGPEGAIVGVIKRRYGKAKPKLNVSVNAPKKLEKLTVATPQWEPTCCTHLPIREEFLDLYAGAASHPSSELTISEWMNTDGRDVKPKEVRMISGANNAATELGWTCTDESDGENDCEIVGGGDNNGCNDPNTENEEELEDSLEGAEMDKLIKRTGVPAVMRCFDRAKIFVKAGSGGRGEVAFLREKFQPEGGPSGGNGGAGGSVYAEVDEEMNSLLPFRNKMHFRGGKGGNGLGKRQNGAVGEDIVVKVAPGTVIKSVDEKGQVGEVLAEILHLQKRVLLVPGGKGGRGNASFKCGSNKVPKIAENGEEGREMWLELELKLVADVGIIGIPNAGKSTLLSAVSDAEPNIAPYPYTTLLPNLGVVSFDYGSTLVVADLPGLLEGAHRGFGLGHEFLRHTERCCVLVHVIDGSSAQPEEEYDAVRLELEMFNPELSQKPFIVAYNKMDLPEARDRWVLFDDSLRSRGIHPFPMSALQRDGTHPVIHAANTLFQTLRKDAKFKDARVMEGDEKASPSSPSPPPSVRVFHVSHDAESRTWNVRGEGLWRFIQMTNWSYVDSEKRFEHVLEACGLNRSLEKKGIREGDIVLIGEMEMTWHDYKDGARPSALVRRSAYSVV